MSLEQRVAVLEAEVAKLKQALADEVGDEEIKRYRWEQKYLHNAQPGLDWHVYDSVQVQK